MPRILIVAYGNPLRCDDGVGWCAADALQGKFTAGEVEILRLHQLAPEVADALRDRDLALFLDAACADLEHGRSGEIHIREIVAADKQEHRPSQFSHVYSPLKILELARDLYGAPPKAIFITVTGENFDHGDRLSDSVAAAIPALVVKVQDLVRIHISNS